MYQTVRMALPREHEQELQLCCAGRHVQQVVNFVQQVVNFVQQVVNFVQQVVNFVQQVVNFSEVNAFCETIKINYYNIKLTVQFQVKLIHKQHYTRHICDCYTFLCTGNIFDQNIPQEI